MINYIFYSVAALGLAYLLFYFFLKGEKDQVFNRVYLLSSLILCLGAPLIEVDLGPARTKIPKIDFEQVFASPSEGFEAPAASRSIEKLEKDKNLFPQSLLGLYVLVSMVLLFRFFRNLWTIWSLIIKNKKILVKELSLIPVKEKGNPFSFFRYIFINEEEYSANSHSTSIFKHEAAHAKQLHSLDIVLLEILLCFFWFNPFLWLYKKALQTTHEYLADAAVIGSGASLEDYSRQLIQAGNKARQLHLISAFNLTQTKNRITMLYASKSSRGARLFKMVSVISLLGLVAIFSSFINSPDRSPFVVVVDAGHGGHDHGILDEKKINLQISRQLAALSNDAEVKIVLTREGDEFLFIEQRTDFFKAQEPDMVLSLHCNGARDPSRSGVEVFISPEGKYFEKSYQFSKILAKQQLEEISEKAEIKEANFKILRDSPYPAVLLELGFLTNEKDRHRLQDPEHQKQLAENLYRSLLLIKESR